MKTAQRVWIAGALALGALGFVATAQAHTSLSFGLNLPLIIGSVPAPVYAPPVAMQPAYVPPAPVYSAPVYAPPVYAAPVYAAPMYAAPVYAAPAVVGPSLYIGAGSGGWYGHRGAWRGNWNHGYRGGWHR